MPLHPQCLEHPVCGQLALLWERRQPRSKNVVRAESSGAEPRTRGSHPDSSCLSLRLVGYVSALPGARAGPCSAFHTARELPHWMPRAPLTGSSPHLQANWELVTATALVILSHSTIFAQHLYAVVGDGRARFLASRSLRYARNAATAWGQVQRCSDPSRNKPRKEQEQSTLSVLPANCGLGRH